MKTKILLIALLLSVIVLSGCVEKDELAGNTYKGPDGDIIRFFDDGKMHYTSPKGTGAAGTYFIEDERVYFTAMFWSGDLDIAGDTLISDNDVYVLLDQ